MTSAKRAGEVYEALQRVRASFDHKVDGACECPYCTSDVEALTLHAADFEMRCHDLEKQVLALKERLADGNRIVEQMKRDAKSTRDIILDRLDSESLVGKKGPCNLGHNPSWVKSWELTKLGTALSGKTQ